MTTTSKNTTTWDPVNRVYNGGPLPTLLADGELETLLWGGDDGGPTDTDGSLRIFGYGSLCWRAGAGVLSNTEEGVTVERATCRGWLRRWCQKSADHRGTPGREGYVCTLLPARSGENENENGNPNVNVDVDAVVRGVVYTIPPHLVESCLQELDLRERGGYARDVVEVEIDNVHNVNNKHNSSSETQTTTLKVRALLYRGTESNPAFCRRALHDLSYAACVISQAVGPSGTNIEYLRNLDRFLRADREYNDDDDDTHRLVRMCDKIEVGKLSVIWPIYGCGSNQHGQLGLTGLTPTNDGDEELVGSLTASALLIPTPSLALNTTTTTNAILRRLYAGGKQSGLLTVDARLYVWGKTETEESDVVPVGSLSDSSTTAMTMNPPDAWKPPMMLEEAFPGVMVEDAALGHDHTLILERFTGQIHCCHGTSSIQTSPSPKITTIDKNDDEFPFPSSLSFAAIAAGVNLSAAILADLKEVLVWDTPTPTPCYNSGSGVTTNISTRRRKCVRRWRLPDDDHDDDVRLVKVRCGHRRTVVVLDSLGRVWTNTDEDSREQRRRRQQQRALRDDPQASSSSSEQRAAWDETPLVMKPVEGFLGRRGSGCIDVDCGWSHFVALVEDEDDPTFSNLDRGKHQHRHRHQRPRKRKLYGWGRNDLLQLGKVTTTSLTPTKKGEESDPRMTVRVPIRIDPPSPSDDDESYASVVAVSCGSEFTLATVRTVTFPANDDGDSDKNSNTPSDINVDMEEQGRRRVKYSTSLWACGWNEHGNLGIGVVDSCKDHDCETYRPWTKVLTGDTNLCHDDGDNDNAPFVVAGGGHFLASTV